jgi:hypothetical protein
MMSRDERGLMKYIFLLISILFYMIYIGPNKFDHTLKYVHDNTVKIVNFEDEFYSNHGHYLAFAPNEIPKELEDELIGCTLFCNPCKYSATVKGDNFTIASECEDLDGKMNYLGYVRASPGAEKGILGYFNKCQEIGIYAVSKNLLNDVGPCYEESFTDLLVVAGSSKKLYLETFPADVEIKVTDAYGNIVENEYYSKTDLWSNYGVYLFENLPTGEISVLAHKKGYIDKSFSFSANHHDEMVIVLEKDPKLSPAMNSD